MIDVNKPVHKILVLSMYAKTHLLNVCAQPSSIDSIKKIQNAGHLSNKTDFLVSTLKNQRTTLSNCKWYPFYG